MESEASDTTPLTSAASHEARRPGPRDVAVRAVRAAPLRAALLLVALVLVASAGWLAWSVVSAYDAVRADLARVEAHALTPTGGVQTAPHELAPLTGDLQQTQHDLRRLQRRLNTPLVMPVIRRLPYIGRRVRASQQAVATGLELTTIAQRGASIGADSYAAYQARGVTPDAINGGGPTWLEVLTQRQPELDELNGRFDAALAARATLDTTALPHGARKALGELDTLLGHVQTLRDAYYPLLPLVETALGAQGDARYLVLLQDSQELHQSGGFPGTYADVELRAGQVSAYEINNIRVFDAAFVAHRTEVLPAPAPIREYVLQQELLPHDVNWGPDFPSVARQLIGMHDIAQLPPLAGVVAVEYSIVQDILRLVGPLTVTIEGVDVTIDADNIVQTIETYRDAQETHKAVVGLIGTALIERLKAADGPTRAAIAEALKTAADRRQMQLYSTDAATQAQLSARGWDGALQPDPGTPTLAMTVSNLTPNKSSNKIRAASDIAIGSGAAGVTHVTWTITLYHGGDPKGDQAYNGYHRAWLALYLPDGATLTDASVPAAPSRLYTDPRERAWVLDLFPGQSRTLTVEFDMPAAQALLLRRQPGFSNVGTHVAVRLPSCVFSATFGLARDTRLGLTACTVAADKP